MRRGIFTRESFIPKGSAKVTDKSSSAIAYVYESAGRYAAAAFHGKKSKPDWHFIFRTSAAMQARIAEHFARVQRWEKARNERALERKSNAHGLAVGDVLRSSWGYDQTNIDYYEVTKLLGKRMVEIREIAQERVDAEIWATGRCVPVPGNYIGKPMRKAAHNGGVKIESYAWASKIEPTLVAGVKVYQPSSYSTYA